MTLLEILYPQGFPEGMTLPVATFTAPGSNGKMKPGEVLWLDEPLIEHIPQDLNVYLSVGLRSAKLVNKQRGDATTVVALPAMWLDLDVAGEAHAAKKLPPTKADAIEIAKCLGIPPTAIVDSGNGLQAWWVLTELWMLDTEAERLKAANLCRGWSATFKKRAALKGWTIDSVFDLARIMRLPGSMNVKDPKNPKPVTIIETSPTRLEVSQIEELVKETAEAPAAMVVVDTLKLDPNAQMPALRWTMLTLDEPRAGLSFAHQRTDFIDQSCSTYDLSLASFAVRAGWSDQEIADLIIAHRRHYGELEKAMRSDTLNGQKGYVAATIAAARKGIEVGADERKLILDAGINEAGAGGNGGFLDYVRRMVSPKINRLLRIGENPPEYRLETEDGSIDLGGISTITNHPGFRDAVAASIGVMIPQYKPDVWNRIAQALLRIAENVSTGEDGSPDGICRQCLEDYLDKNPPSEVDTAADRTPGVTSDGTTYIFRDNFHTWIKRNHAWEVKAQTLAKLLRMIGAKPKLKRVGSGNPHRIWEVPAKVTAPIEPRSYMDGPKK